MWDGGIGLKTNYSVTKYFNVKTAGTYYFYINGYSMSYGDNTEYTFKIQGVEPTTITMQATAGVDKGKTIKLVPTVLPTTPARTLTWMSSNTSVATVQTDGTVKGVKAGTATITATVNGVSNVYATCTVTVWQPLTKITLNKTKVTLKKGKKFTLKVKKWTPTAVSAKYKKLKFATSNKKVATVSSKGVVKAKKKGKATITVTASNGKKYKCKVTVK
jgi:uncharacterized protein YjdB